MPRFELRYTATRTPSPVSFWVHEAEDPELDAEGWIRAERHRPPMPGPVPGHGFPNLFLEVGDRELHFASSAEVRHVIDVLSHDPLPNTLALARARHPTAGPNRHWLSRFPAELRSQRRRAQIVRQLEQALEAQRKDDVAF